MIEKSDNQNDDGFAYSNVGEALVIWESLLSLKHEARDDWLRSNIFHFMCRISGKVCKLIIDSDSCESVISQEVVDKLQLKQENHPWPYILCWFMKNNEVVIVSHSLISFSIGNWYFYCVKYDVVWLVFVGAYHIFFFFFLFFLVGWGEDMEYI